MIMEFKGDGVSTGTSAGFGLLEIGFGTENKYFDVTALSFLPL